MQEHRPCKDCLTFALSAGKWPVKGTQINTPDGTQWRVTGVYQTRPTTDGIHQEWRLHAEKLSVLSGFFTLPLFIDDELRKLLLAPIRQLCAVKDG